MNARTLSQAEALKIITNEDAENLPFRIINEAGQTAVAQFVNSQASDPARHNLGAWYSDAEQAANDAIPGETIIIEMPGRSTVSGNPETLRMDDEHFDWLIND